MNLTELQYTTRSGDPVEDNWLKETLCYRNECSHQEKSRPLLIQRIWDWSRLRDLFVFIYSLDLYSTFLLIWIPKEANNNSYFNTHLDNLFQLSPFFVIWTRLISILMYGCEDMVHNIWKLQIWGAWLSWSPGLVIMMNEPGLTPPSLDWDHG